MPVKVALMENESNKPIPAWHKLEKESANDFNYFEVYLKQSVPRSARLVAKTCGKSASHIEKMASRHKWVDRAEKYDDWKRDIELQKHEESIEQTAEDENRLWSKRRLEIRNKEYSCGSELLELGKQHLQRYRDLLKMPTVEQKTTRRRFSEDGKEITEEITVKPLVHRTGDPVKAIEVGLKLMRNAAELPSEKIEHSFTPSHTAAEDFVTLTEEERIKRRQELAEEEAKLLEELQRREAENKQA